jgi:hypothetical protein
VESRTSKGARDVELLASFLVGTWESVAQAPGAGDSTPVRMRSVRFWMERAGEFWVYSEYEKPSDSGRPYRQRIYRLGEAGGVLTTLVYEIPGEAQRFAGEWRKAKPFEEFSPQGLHERGGCRILWVRQVIMYSGGTLGKQCPGSALGAAYETEEFLLTSATLRTWQRGFDSNGTQVSGSMDGPLDLRRLSSMAR